VRPTTRPPSSPPKKNSLATTPSTTYNVVLTNPPFGKKSSITVVNEEGDEAREALTYVRDDFWATTSNKQLNFLQHVKSLQRAKQSRGKH
jgi:type I restriction enzyme M protein